MDKRKALIGTALASLMNAGCALQASKANSQTDRPIERKPVRSTYGRDGKAQTNLR